MLRTTIGLIVAAALALLVGCGGGGGSNGDSQASVVRIESTRFNAKTVTIRVGDRVQWTNVDTNSHQVVSGTLSPTTNPQVLTPIIEIEQDNTFTPSTFQARLGDTVQFRNDRSAAFTMDIVNDAGAVVATLSFVQSGQVIPFNQFPTAGLYLIQQQGNPNFRGTITVFGAPNPDNRFQSQVLGNGGTFITQFVNPGTYPYFDLNPANPSRSFMTGTVIVQ
jgi:plastocyanin